MAKTQVSVRFDRDTLHRVDAYAKEHGTTRTEILESAAVAMLERDSSQGSEPDTETLKAHLEDVRGYMRHLEMQLEAKDAQIAALTTIADHAQTLQAAAEVRGIAAPKTEPVEAEEEQAEGEDDSGFWAWIKSIFQSLGE